MKLTRFIRRRFGSARGFAAVAVALLCALLATACPNLAMWEQESAFTTVAPDVDDLTGTWVPTPETLGFMKEGGGYAISRHEIVLREDGSFSVVNMPDWWKDGFGWSTQGFESSEGTWQLGRDYGTPGTYSVELDSGSYFTSFHLQENEPPYRIFINVGDPDGGRYMIFVREDGT